MKTALLVCFVALCALLIGDIEAAPELREKRATAIGHCPEGTTIEECQLYAKGKAEGKCIRYNVRNGKIHWASCGKVMCEPPFVLGKKDLSKPYPQCCAGCERPN